LWGTSSAALRILSCHIVPRHRHCLNNGSNTSHDDNEVPWCITDVMRYRHEVHSEENWIMSQSLKQNPQFWLWALSSLNNLNLTNSRLLPGISGYHLLGISLAPTQPEMLCPQEVGHLSVLSPLSGYHLLQNYTYISFVYHQPLHCFASHLALTSCKPCMSRLGIQSRRGFAPKQSLCPSWPDPRLHTFQPWR
jgi:hypothetical protein